MIDNAKRVSSLENQGLVLINRLFALEEKIKDLDFHDSLKIRATNSQKIIDEFYAYVETNNFKALPQSLLGKAFTYAKNQKKYLLSFLNDGRIELSNNRAERSIKPFVIGRKNWLFSNTPSGAKSSAMIYSITQTAIENRLNPQAYLQYIFEEIQKGNINDFRSLLPWAENIPDNCKIECH